MADKPEYTKDQILTQIQTSWASTDAHYRAWPDTKQTITYFIASSVSVPGDVNEQAGWSAMTQDEIDNATAAFNTWNELISNVQFAPVTAAKDADVTFAYSGTTTGNLTYTHIHRKSDGISTSHDKITGDQIWVSTTSDSTKSGNVDPGGYGFETYLHEIGHSLGLSHPGVYDASNAVAPTYDKNAVFKQDTRQYTIMSYFGAETATGWDTAQNAAAVGNPATPMVYDIAAIQSKYGANYTTRSGDTTYGFNSNVGKDLYDFDKNTHPVFTIWDGGGNDTIDASKYTGSQRIDLNPGAYSDIDGLTDNVGIAFVPADDPHPLNCLIENAICGAGDDVVTGNVASNLLVGGDGNDVLSGETGYDTLTGGEGDDIFVFTPKEGLVITDFSADDTLDLSSAPVSSFDQVLHDATQVGDDVVLDLGTADEAGSMGDKITLQGVDLADLTASEFGFSNAGGFLLHLNPGTYSPQVEQSAPLQGGGFVVVEWNYVDPDLIAHEYDATGALVRDVKVNTSPNDAGGASIGLGSGRVLVTWTTKDVVNDQYDIFGRLLDPTGALLGDAFLIGKNSSPLLTGTPGGGAIVSWVGDGYVYEVGFDADGNNVTGQKIVGPGTSNPFEPNPRIGTFLAVDGSSVHVYSPGDGYLYYAINDGVGIAVSSNVIGSVSVSALTDGRVLITYEAGEVTQYSQHFYGSAALILDADLKGLTQVGTVGDDTLGGGGGDNRIYGQGGDDLLKTGPGHDLLDGGGGTDTVTYALSPGGVTIDLTLADPQKSGGYADGDTLVSIENLVGSHFADLLTGDAGPNRIDGGGGPDTINGGGGADTLNGGKGPDQIHAQGEGEQVHGDEGDDIISVSGENGQIYGDDGDDVISVSGVGNIVDGGSGDDVLSVTSGRENELVGGDGRDTLRGGPAGTTGTFMAGGEGDDTYQLTPGAAAIRDGGENGTDKVLIDGAVSDFSITWQPGRDVLSLHDLRAQPRVGDTRITGVETFQFSDATLSESEVIGRAKLNTTAIISGVTTGKVSLNGTHTASGQLSLQDPDPGDASLGLPSQYLGYYTQYTGIYGVFSLDANTLRWTFTVDPAGEGWTYLKPGQTDDQVVTLVSADGSASVQLDVTVSLDPPNAGPVTTYNPDGSIHDIAYSAITGKPYTSYDVLYGANGKPATATYSDGEVVTYGYDAAGATRDILHTGLPADRGFAGEHDVFDAQGALTAVTRAFADGTVAFAYSLAGGVATTDVFDASGAKTRHVVTGPGGTSDTTLYAGGTPTRETVIDGSGAKTVDLYAGLGAAAYIAEHDAYDAADVLRARDLYALDASGARYLSEHDEHDASGRLTVATKTHADGSPASGFALAADGTRTTDLYDAAGRPTLHATTRPDGSTDTTSYRDGATFETRIAADGAKEVLVGGLTGRAYTGERDVYDAGGHHLLQSFDYADGTHAITLLAPGVTVSSSAGADTFFSVGADTFVFPAAFGHDTIRGFHAGTGATHDTLDLGAVGVRGLGDITLTASGHDTLITLDPADTILLLGVAPQSLTSDDFHFA